MNVAEELPYASSAPCRQKRSIVPEVPGACVATNENESVEAESQAKDGFAASVDVEGEVDGGARRAVARAMVASEAAVRWRRRGGRVGGGGEGGGGTGGGGEGGGGEGGGGGAAAARAMAASEAAVTAMADGGACG